MLYNLGKDIVAQVSEVPVGQPPLMLNNSIEVFDVVIVGVAEVIVVLMETECDPDGTWNLYQTSLLFVQDPVTTVLVAPYSVPGNVEQVGPTVTGIALAHRSFAGCENEENEHNNSNNARTNGFFIGRIMDL